MTIIYHADCREILCKMKSESVDVIFVDPPYGTGNDRSKIASYSTSDFMRTRNWDNFHADWDNPVDVEFTWQWLYESRRVLKPNGSIFICGTFHNIPITSLLMNQLKFYTIQWIQWIIPNAFPHLAGKKMGNANQTLIWARPNREPAQRYNYARAKAWNDGKNLRDFWSIDYTSDEIREYVQQLNESWWVHNNSTQAVREMPELAKFKAKKPYALVARALDITLPDDTPSVVLDCFAGSGTTGAVVQRINEFIPIRREQPIECILVERSKANVDQFIVPRLGVDAIPWAGGEA